MSTTNFKVLELLGSSEDASVPQKLLNSNSSTGVLLPGQRVTKGSSMLSVSGELSWEEVSPSPQKGKSRRSAPSHHRARPRSRQTAEEKRQALLDSKRVIIPAVKTHSIAFKPPKKAYGGTGEGESWASFKKRAENILLGGEGNGSDNLAPRSSNNNLDDAIFDLTEVDGGLLGNRDGGSQLNHVPSADEDLDNLDNIIKPPKPLGSVSRMGKELNAKQRHSKTSASKSDVVSTSVKLGRVGGVKAQMMEIDVIKYICMRESLVSRLRAVGKVLRKASKELLMSRMSAGEPLKLDLVDKVRTNQKLFKRLLGDLRKGSVAVVEAICEWRRVIAEEENNQDKSEYTTVTFMWQGYNYLMKMKRDTKPFLKARKKNKRNGLYPGMPPAERVKALQKDDSRDPLTLWIGMKCGASNPLFIPPAELDVVNTLQQEKAEWEKELEIAKHEEAEEISRAYMNRHLSKNFRGVLTTDESAPVAQNTVEEEKTGTAEGNATNPSTADFSSAPPSTAPATADVEAGASIISEPSKTSVPEGGEQPEVQQKVVREAWRWFALDMAFENSLVPNLEERISDRVMEAQKVLLMEDEVEKYIEEQKRQRLELDDTYDAITSIAECGGVVAILDSVLDHPPAGREADAKLRSRQQERNLRGALTGTMTMPKDPGNIDEDSVGVPAMKPSRARMEERLNELLEDEGCLHTAYDTNGASAMFGSSLKRRPGATESRRFFRWQKRAAVRIQALMRGSLSRLPNSRVNQMFRAREERRKKAATEIQRVARGMLGRLYVEDFRMANQRKMTEEEAAVIVQAGLRAMWARKYVGVIRDYEYLKREEARKAEEDKQPSMKVTFQVENDNTFVTNLAMSHSQNFEGKEQGESGGEFSDDDELEMTGGFDDPVDILRDPLFQEDSIHAESSMQESKEGFVSKKRNEVQDARNGEETHKVIQEGLLTEEV